MTIELAVTLLWFVAVVQGALLLVLYRQVGLHVLKRLAAVYRDGPSIGERLPRKVIAAIAASDAPDSKTWSRRMLVFARPSCILCQALWPQLVEYLEDNPTIGASVLLAADERSAEKYRTSNGLNLPIVADGREDLFGACSVRVTPFAVVIDREFVVTAKGPVNHKDHCIHLIRQSSGIPSVADGALGIEGSSNARELA